MPTTRTPDGLSLHVTRTGTGPAVVLVAGAGDDHSAWDAVVPLLAGRASVHAVDRRGRGGSEDRPGSTVEDEVADLVAVLTDVQAGGGPGALLVGHSSGAVLALRAAARVSGLRGVVGYEPPPPPPVTDPPVATRLRRLADAGDADGAVRTFLTDAVGLPAAMVEANLGRAGWQGMRAYAGTLAYDAAVVAAGVPDDEIAALTAPVTLLLGTAGPAPMAEHVHALAGRIPGATVVPLDGQRHDAMRTAPDLLAAALPR